MVRFNGLTDNQWRLIEGFFQSLKKEEKENLIHRGEPVNTILWVLTTGSRWCDVPTGKEWASCSVSHR